jgi:predicted nucleic acid-binding protein
MARTAAAKKKRAPPLVDVILDTSIVIDLLRNHPPAINWLATNHLNLGITSISWVEIIEGASNKREQNQVVKLLKSFALVDTEQVDIDWGITQLLKNYLSHNIDSGDWIITGVSLCLNIPLYTINLRHFSLLIGRQAQKPY